MNKKQPIQAGLGTSSIVLIFLVLCLTSFAVLSLVSARNSDKLTQKSTEYVTAYYNAAALANESISAKAEAGIPGQYSESFAINDELSLMTAFTVNSDGTVTIERFCVESEDSGGFEDFE